MCIINSQLWGYRGNNFFSGANFSATLSDTIRSYGGKLDSDVRDLGIYMRGIQGLCEGKAGRGQVLTVGDDGIKDLLLSPDGASGVSN